MQRVFRNFAAAGLACALIALAAPGRSVRDAVYSKAQADRGHRLYDEECAKCHGPNLGGGEGAPALVGADFMTKYGGKPLNALYETTRVTMPLDDPGHLSRRQTADLIAYMLSANDLPAGDKDLDNTADALNDIRMEPKK